MWHSRSQWLPGRLINTWIRRDPYRSVAGLMMCGLMMDGRMGGRIGRRVCSWSDGWIGGWTYGLADASTRVTVGVRSLWVCDPTYAAT